MDIELLKTFLEVSRTRHFGHAANNLFLTQSAVSARIKQLEEHVGAPLFHRERNNIRLTAAGQKLLRNAEGIVTLWNRARQQIAVDEAVESSLTIAGVASLWDICLQDWLNAICASQRRLLIQAEEQSAETQGRRLRDGTLDLGFLFDAPNITGIEVCAFARIPLILVSTRPDQSVEQATGDGYVLVDWGTSFATAHSRHFPAVPLPLLRVSHGRIAYSLLQKTGGAAYLAEPSVRQDLKNLQLYRVTAAPTIERTAYAAYAADGERADIISWALELLAKTLPDSIVVDLF
jgi:DNA-binding transcriptional LysR family regulator